MSNLSINTNDSTSKKISVLAGVIRRVNNKWQLINDQGHAPIGLSGVISEPNSTSIQVNFDKTYSKVLTCSVTADEAYAQRGFVFGASCGFDKILIWHSKAGTPTTNTDLNVIGSNIWIHILMYD